MTGNLQQLIDGDFSQEIARATHDERLEVLQIGLRSRATARELLGRAIIVSVVSVLLAVLIGLLLFRAIKRPIDTLFAGTTKIAQGDLGYRIAVRKPVEMAGLASSFNRMGEDLQRQQQRLLGTQAELEVKVRERTDALHRANQELRRLDQTRRRFFADISHELRTPLTVIRGEAEVTLRGADKTASEYQTALRRIVGLSEQMSHLVDDLLGLARSDAVNTHTEVDVFMLDRLLNETCDNARSLAKVKNLNLSVALSDRDLRIHGQQQQLAQLLMILVDNACRYSQPEDDIAVSLEKDGDAAVITVSDTGVGIEQADLEHVFERLYRGRQAKAMVPEGSGLGLPLARSIVADHHGTISVNSTPGIGTTVTVWLPLSAN